MDEQLADVLRRPKRVRRSDSDQYASLFLVTSFTRDFVFVVGVEVDSETISVEVVSDDASSEVVASAVSPDANVDKVSEFVGSKT